MQRKPLPPYVETTEYTHTPNVSSPEIGSSPYHDVFSHGAEIKNKDAGQTTTPFLNGTSSSNSAKTAEWGISWLGKPLQLPFYTFLGIGLAVTHHLAYRSLDGTVVGDSKLGQQAVKQIGNVFVFLAMACLKLAIDESYNQYMWLTIRRKPFAIEILDKLFMLPNSILSIFSLGLIGRAKLAALLGLFTWLLFLGGLTPAATLSIVPALQNTTVPRMVPVPDYNTSSWWQIQEVNTNPTIDPTAIHLKTATSSAFGSAVIPPPAPAANSSFSVQFYGPTVKCEDADSGQNAAFEAFSKAFFLRNSIVTTENMGNPPNGRPVRGYLIMSAFSPTQNIPDEPYERKELLKTYNNWEAPLTSGYQYLSDYDGHQQLWVQTAERNIVCSLVNASFDVGFDYVGGVGKVTHQHVQVLPPAAPFNTSALTIRYGDAALGDDAPTWENHNAAYYASFIALGVNIYGNVSLENQTTKGQERFIKISQASSRMLQTGLAACDEFADNYWARNLGYDTKALFPNPPYMCRNRTIDRALEDLSNNITVSMLSVEGMTSMISVPVRISTIANVYSYEQLDLLVSYGATIAVALICVFIGVVSLIKNGIYHSTTFSTVLATTRNPDLDVLTEGACLGSGKTMMDQKLMFGVLAGTNGGQVRDTYEGGNNNGTIQHAAFGLEGTVIKIRKGTACS